MGAFLRPYTDKHNIDPHATLQNDDAWWVAPHEDALNENKHTTCNTMMAFVLLRTVSNSCTSELAPNRNDCKGKARVHESTAPTAKVCRVSKGLVCRGVGAHHKAVGWGVEDFSQSVKQMFTSQSLGKTTQE